MKGWTSARIGQLRQLWANGYSACDIAGRLGDITRNAVIGKIHRLKLPVPDVKRQSIIKVIRQKRLKPAFRAKTATRRCGDIKTSALLEPASSEFKPEPSPTTLAERRRDQCCWPVSDDQSHLYCGASRAPNKVYCEHHAKMRVSTRTLRPLSIPYAHTIRNKSAML